MPRGDWDDRAGRGVELGEGRDRMRDDWRMRDDETRWREQAHGYRGGERDDWRHRDRDDWRFGERDEWRPGERHDWRGGEREWRGGGRDLGWEQGMEDRAQGPRYEGRWVRRGTGGERGDWRGRGTEPHPRPWMDSEPLARDTRGMYEWEDRGPLAWLRRDRDDRGAKPRGPKGYKRSDERIHDEVCERIARSGVDADEVEVKVENGEVTLTGTVGMREHKWRLESIADDVWGVEDVHNQLRIHRGGTEAERQGTQDLRH
jgi:hypothetical protein